MFRATGLPICRIGNFVAMWRYLGKEMTMRTTICLGIICVLSAAAHAAVIGKATVTADQAPVMSGKQTIATAKKGDTFDVTELKGDWFGVAPSQGWVHKSNVRYEPAPPRQDALLNESDAEKRFSKLVMGVESVFDLPTPGNVVIPKEIMESPTFKAIEEEGAKRIIGWSWEPLDSQTKTLTVDSIRQKCGVPTRENHNGSAIYGRIGYLTQDQRTISRILVLPAAGDRNALFPISRRDVKPEPFVGKWKDVEGMVEMELRLGNWDENVKTRREGDGVAFLCVWAGKPNAEGKRLLRAAGYVIWKKVGKGVTFEGAVGNGTATLDGDNALSLFWEEPSYSGHTAKHQALLKWQEPP